MGRDTRDVQSCRHYLATRTCFCTTCKKLVQEENLTGNFAQEILCCMTYVRFTNREENLKPPVTVQFKYMKTMEFWVLPKSLTISRGDRQTENVDIIASQWTVWVRRNYHIRTPARPGQIRMWNMLVTCYVKEQCQPVNSSVHSSTAQNIVANRKGRTETDKNKYLRNQMNQWVIFNMMTTVQTYFSKWTCVVSHTSWCEC